VGKAPYAIAITPDSKTAYVTNARGASVSPVNLVKDKALPPIKVGANPGAIAMGPDGKTVYVASDYDFRSQGTVTPIDVATNTAGTPIKVGIDPTVIQIPAGGTTAYVLDQASTGITPIDLTTNTTKPFVGVGVGNGQISSMLLAPDGSMAYVGRFASTKKGAPPLPAG
jgi:DNA-binding beta-propeller fold protein YncE